MASSGWPKALVRLFVLYSTRAAKLANKELATDAAMARYRDGWLQSIGEEGEDAAERTKGEERKEALFYTNGNKLLN